MGFLAFLVIGGATGCAAWILHPGSSKNRSKTANFRNLVLASLLGFVAALASSYLGQYTHFFQSGQMLEWASAILASCTIGCLYTSLAK
ncbi:hypothetical protein [Polynucleobacter sp. MWH-UH23A]|uniref:hypothetical protein n=1 Tax=Polynucleobacter sp. MWH-UH23A TaxID=1855613 RepID=UPI003364C950